MDLLGDLNAIWVDCVCSFFMLCFLFFVVFLIWQHFKNMTAQKEIIAQYEHNLRILRDLKNRF